MQLTVTYDVKTKRWTIAAPHAMGTTTKDELKALDVFAVILDVARHLAEEENKINV